MRRLAAVLVSVLLVCCVMASVAQSAPKGNNGLLGRISDAILGDKNIPGVLKPILGDEDASSQLSVILGPTIYDRIKELEIDRLRLGWAPRELDKDASSVRFGEAGVASFEMKSDAEVSRQQFFHIYGRDLKLTDNDAMEEYHSFDDQIQTPTETIEYHHSRHQQHYKGVPVVGAHYLIQEKNGYVESGVGKLAQNLDVDVNPTFLKEQAKTSALESLDVETFIWESSLCQPTDDNCIPLDDGTWDCPDGVDLPGLDVNSLGCQQPEGKLVIVGRDGDIRNGDFKLAWRFFISTMSPRASYVVDVDAKTGEVISARDRMVWQNVPSEGDTLFYGRRPFSSYRASDGYCYLYHTKNSGDPYAQYLSTYIDMGNPSNPFFPGEGDNLDGLYRTSDDGSCVFDDPTDLLGVSLHWGVEQAVKFFDQFGVKGWGVQGERDVHARVHFDVSILAHFDPNIWEIWMRGFESDIAYETLDLWSIGHEYAHAVMFSFIPDLLDSGEPLLINESMADIFSVMIGEYALGEADWCIGDELRKDGSCLRMGNDPHATNYPDTYEGMLYIPITEECEYGVNDWCHGNSTVPLYWFYLLSEGGSGVNDHDYAYSVDPIGIDKAGAIALQAVRKYLDPTPSMLDLRYATEQAARTMYPNINGADSPELKSVSDAWAAVGVGDAYDGGYFSPKNGEPDVSAWPARLIWKGDDGVEERVLVSMSPAFDKSFILSPTKETPLLPEPGSGFGNRKVLRTAELNLRSNMNYYWRVVSFDAPSSGGGGGNGGFGIGYGFSLISKLKDLIGIGDPVDPDEPNLSPPYSTTPNYTDVSKSPIRYFKTSKMQSELLYPNPIDRAHPWQATLVTGYIPGSTHVHIDITDIETGEFEHITVDADDVLDDSNKTYVVERDLKVDRHYRWKAYVQGPAVNDGLPFIFNTGRTSPEMEFWTSVPVVQLIHPAAEAEVQPQAFFQWSELPGIGSEVGNGAYYRLIVSRNADLSNPIHSVDNLFDPEHTLNLPPTNDLGMPAEYYWSVLPIGPSTHGESGDLADPVHFKVDASSTKPVARNPKGYEVYNTSGIVFYWMPVDGAEGYTFDVYHANGQHEMTLNAPLGEVEIHPDGSASFFAGHSVDWSRVSTDPAGYCWDVRGIFAGNPGLRSDQLCYAISGSKPVNIMPKQGSQVMKGYNEPLAFMWDALYAPNGYVFEIWKGEHCFNDSYLWERAVIADGNVKSYASLADQHYASRFTWRVCTLTPVGSHSSCSHCDFFDLRIGHEEEEDDPPDDPQSCPTPQAPTIVQPASMSIHNLPQVTVQWTEVPAAVNYHWELQGSGNALTPFTGEDGVVLASGSTPGISTVLQMENILIANGAPMLSLWLDNDLYMATVRAVNDCGKMSAEEFVLFIMDVY